jgi:cytoskeletal protein RodZ
VAGVSVEIGNFLRQARESVGLSLDEVQEKTRIQKSFLEAIEKGDFDKLPSPFYVRTYLRSYANCVKVEPHYILREYRKKEQAERYQTGQFDATQLTEQLNKLSQTGMHKFGFTGAMPKVSPNTKPSAAINRTSAKTALTIANPISNSGKLPMMQRREELEKTARPQVLSSSKPKKEQKFPSLLPSQALTTRGGTPTKKEKRLETKENPAVKPSNNEGRTAVEQTTLSQKQQTSRLKKQVTSPQSTTSSNAQFVPSRLSRTAESSTLSRTQANKRPTQPEKTVNSNTQPSKLEQSASSLQESTTLSRSSRFRNSTTLPTVDNKFLKGNTELQDTESIDEVDFEDKSPLGFRESQIPSRNTGDLNTAPSITQNASEIKTLRRSSARNRPTQNSNNFFSTRVIIASIAAVLLLGTIGWYLLSGNDEDNTKAVQEKKTTTEEPKTEQKQQTASPSSEESTTEGDLVKESPGLYTLTGTNTAKIVLNPSGTSWIQLRTKDANTHPKEYLKDITLTSKDAAFKYDHTFTDVSDLYIVLGSPDNVKVTVNGIPVASSKTIHIVKK